MVKAFVFGKFRPFHKGHEAMITFAMTKCDFLTVLVCCSDKEKISCPTRKSWIEQSLTPGPHFEVRTFSYSENELPNTSVSSRKSSEGWAKKFRELLPDYDYVITSEEYGDYVASFMGIKHIGFDIARQKFPTSATAIRNDLFSNWDFLPDSVKPHFAIKVVILGTESTGKSTLSELLVRHFNCTGVKETARELIINSNSISFEDLNFLAAEHAKQIDRAVLQKSPLIIIDTDIHTTMSYAAFMFKERLEVDEDVYNSSKADLYLYLNNDVEYIQDGTRLNHVNRDFLDLSHREVLSRQKINFVEISGNWNMRFEKAVKEIDQLIDKQGKK